VHHDLRIPVRFSLTMPPSRAIYEKRGYRGYEMIYEKELARHGA